MSLVVGNSKKPCGISDTDEGDFCLNPAAAAQPLERRTRFSGHANSRLLRTTANSTKQMAEPYLGE